MKNTQRGFIGIAVIILLAAAVSGGLYYKVKINPEFMSSNDGTLGRLPIKVVGTTTNDAPVEKKDRVDTETSVGIKAPSIPSTSVSLSNNSKVDGVPEQKAPISTPVEISGNVKTCSDAKCFTDAIDACGSAKFTRSSKGNLLGSFIDANFTFETVKNSPLCSVKVRLNKYNLSASEGVSKLAPSGSSGQIEEMYINENLKAQILIGKAGVCTLKNNKEAFVELLEKNLEFYLMMGGIGCEGELFKEIDKLMHG